MKLFLAITLLSSFAFATSMDFFVASVSPVDSEISAASVSQSGFLFIKKSNGEQKQVRLADANARELLHLASSLNGAELKTEEHFVICKMMLPDFSRQTLFVRFDATAAMQTVLSVESCAVMNFTHPVSDFQMLQARLLKAELMTLARQLAQN